MKKSLITLFYCFSFIFAQGQGVGIGTTTPDPSARLEVTATDRGILIPRVNLTATNNPSPVTSPATSLLVYNLSTINDVVPGYYYWDGAQWVRLSTGSNDAWLLNGNSGTNPAVNFVGTIDAQPLTFRTNNTARFRIANGNQVFGLNGGTAAAPFYSWENDANTGLYNPANDELGLSTNSTERVRIDANGNVGINTSPNTSAILDISASNRGIRIPNVALVARNNNSPIGAAIVNSLLVYNTATSGTGINAVSPGYYYWDATAGLWMRLVDATSNDWALLGNANTDPNVNFIGTTDAQALTFRTNNTARFRIANGNQVHALANGTANTPFYSWEADADIGMFRASVNELGFSTAGTERMRIAANGNIGIGTSTPDASAILDVSSNNKGFIAPRVALTAANNPAPITAPASGLIVYNTATSGTYPDNVSPGYYYWNGSRWIKSVSQNISLWYYPPTNINALTRYSITGTLPGISSNDAIFVNLVGDWGAVPGVVIEHVEARTNEIRFVVYNRTITNYIGMDFRIAVIKP